MLKFRGHHIHTIDQKGRLSIPSKFREILRTEYDERLMVSFLGHCLAAYPYSEWEKLEENFLRLPQGDKRVNQYLRTFLSAVEECPLDTQGRILIPPILRERAGLKDKVKVLGCLYKIEIWDYDRAVTEVDDKFAEVSSVTEQLSEQFRF